MKPETTTQPTATKICSHGNAYYCGLCASEKAPKCKHGNAFYCGHCLGETGSGRVPSATEERP